MSSRSAVACYALWIACLDVITYASAKTTTCEGDLCQASNHSSLLQRASFDAVVNAHHQVGACSREEGWVSCEDAKSDMSSTNLFSSSTRMSRMQMGGLFSDHRMDLSDALALKSKHHCEWDCKRIEVPSNYGERDGAKLEIYLRRARSRKPKNQQLWMLQGGPGATGEALTMFLPLVGDWVSDFDVYVPDHRGVPFSTSMRCHAATQAYYRSDKNLSITCSSSTPCIIPDPAWLKPSFASACFAEVQQNGFVMQDFSVSNAARDVLYLMKQTNQDETTSFNIYGISYGTTWGQRILHVSLAERAEWPKISRAILSGVVSSQANFDHFSLGANYAGRKLMEYCGADSLCSQHYGSGEQAWNGLLEKVETISQNRTSCAAALLATIGGEVPARQRISTLLFISLVWGHQLETIDLIDQLSQSSSAIRPFAVSSTSSLGIPTDLFFDIDFRIWALIVVHRAARCDAMSGDQNVDKYFAAFDFFIQALVGDMTEEEIAHASAKDSNQILYEQIINTELLSNRNGGKVASVYSNEKPDEIVFNVGNQHDGDTWYFDNITGTTSPWPTAGIWPYDNSHADAYSTSKVSSDASVLFINGDLDGQTASWNAQVAYDNLTSSACKKVVSLPGWGHGAVFNTKCGKDALATFMGASVAEACPALTTLNCEMSADLDFAKAGGSNSFITDTMFESSGYWGGLGSQNQSQKVGDAPNAVAAAARFGISKERLNKAVRHSMLQHEI